MSRRSRWGDELGDGGRGVGEGRGAGHVDQTAEPPVDDVNPTPAVGSFACYGSASAASAAFRMTSCGASSPVHSSMLTGALVDEHPDAVHGPAPLRRRGGEELRAERVVHEVGHDLARP